MNRPSAVSQRTLGRWIARRRAARRWLVCRRSRGRPQGSGEAANSTLPDDPGEPGDHRHRRRQTRSALYLRRHHRRPRKLHHYRGRYPWSKGEDGTARNPAELRLGGFTLRGRAAGVSRPRSRRRCRSRVRGHAGVPAQAASRAGARVPGPAAAARVVAMEACGGAHHWAREITGLGHEARLIPPAYVKPNAQAAEERRRGRGGDRRGRLAVHDALRRGEECREAGGGADVQDTRPAGAP